MLELLNSFAVESRCGQTSPSRPSADARDRSAGSPAAGAGADQHLHPSQHAARVRAPAVRGGGRAAPPRGWGANRSWPSRAIATSWRRAGFVARDVEALLVEQLGASGARGRRRRRIPPRSLAGRRAARHSRRERGGSSRGSSKKPTALSRFRTDVPANARSALAALRELDDRAATSGGRCAGCGRRASTRPARGRRASPPPRSAGSPSRLAARRARPRHRRLDPSAAHSIPGRLSRSGSRALVDAGTGPRHPRLLSGDLPHAAGGTVRPLGANAAGLVAEDRAAGRGRARLDRPLPRPARRRRRRIRGLSERRTARPARMGRHRASDRGAARPRAGAGPDGDAARIPRGAPAVRTGGARPGGAAISFSGPLSELRGRLRPAPSPPGPDGDRARVAAVPRGAALRPRRVDGRAVDRAARRRARSRAAAARRRAPAANPAPGVRASDSPSPLRRAGASRAASASRERRRSRRSSASTSGRSRSAGTWRRSRRTARRSAPPGSSAWRCTTGASADAHPRRSARWRSVPSTRSPKSKRTATP